MCRLDLKQQVCTALSHPKSSSNTSASCSSYSCASKCEVILTVTEGAHKVCTAPAKFDAFGNKIHDGMNSHDWKFPRKTCSPCPTHDEICIKKEKDLSVSCFSGTEYSLSVLSEGKATPIKNAVRFLGAPMMANNSAGVQITAADGWYHDPMAMTITETRELPALVADIRNNKGTYIFVRHRVTDISPISSSNQILAAQEGKYLVESAHPPTGQSHFPTAPISCISMPHAAHVCGREASSTYFEDACFKPQSPPLSTCGFACLYDFDNDGDVTTNDVDLLQQRLNESSSEGFDFPMRVKDTNSDGTFDSNDVDTVRQWLQNASADDTVCNSHFREFTKNGAYFARNGHPKNQHHSIVSSNPNAAIPFTMCTVNTQDETDDAQKKVGPAYVTDQINGKADSDAGRCFTDFSSILAHATERAFFSFGSRPDACAFDACAASLGIDCTTLSKTTLNYAYVAPQTTPDRRHLSSPASTVAPAATAEPLPTSATTSKSARRSLLRSTTRQLQTNSPPPALPPSPPPNHPTLPSYEEWIEIITATFTGPLPAGVLLVLNGFMAVMSITLFQPMEDIADAFSSVLKADPRVRRAACAFGLTNLCSV